MLPTERTDVKAGSGRRPKPLSRSSSFLGTIKNIVKAPLAWFTPDDDFEDTAGKRRRLVPEPTIREEENPRAKRIRVDSPEREQPPPPRRRSAQSSHYLDPPRTAFQQHQQEQQATHPFTFTYNVSGRAQSQNPIYRAVSAQLNRQTMPPARGLSRTMSMDPPSRYNDAAMVPLPPTPVESQFRRDSLVDSLRDVSMTPGSPARVGNSFRLRSSITPQPLSFDRQKSAPPPLTTLESNPVFVRPPPAGPKQTQREQSVTLGALAGEYRRTRSPLRQHTSLVFETRTDSAAERALHELDVYKTPLLPSRLRTGTSQSVPDMFRQMRKSHAPKLMPDSTRRAGGSLGRSRPEVNESKPYAGEGGMKKLLARRKLEADQEREKAEREQRERAAEQEDDDMDDLDDDMGYEEYQRMRNTKRQQKQKLSNVRNISPPNPIPETGLYDKAVHHRAREPAASDAGGSSLRVGRTKNRNHIERPATSANKFSAFEEEDPADAEESEKAKEVRRELEEAAKRVPAFKVPEGFTFNKPPTQHDHSNEKEPPIASLPFSFAASPAPSPSLDSTPRPAVTAPKIALVPPTPELPTPAPAKEEAIAAPAPAKEEAIAAPIAVPNFFARRAAPLKPAESPSFLFGAPAEIPKRTASPSFELLQASQEKPVDTAKPTSLSSFAKAPEVKPDAATKADAPSSIPNFFGAQKPTGSALSGAIAFTAPMPSGAPSPAIPVTDAKENPFWAGEPSVPVVSSSMFGSALKPAESVPAASPFSFGGSAKPVGSEAPKPVPSFSFGAPAKAPEPEAPKPVPSFGSSPGSLFGVSAAAPPSSAPAPFSFGAPASATKASEPPKSVFSFGAAPAPTPAAAASEAPRSLFGGPASSSSSSGFGATSNAPAKDKNPFGFGAAPATPPAAEKKTGFDFGVSPATPAVSSPFSFGTSAPSAAPSFAAPAPAAGGFSFGAPARPLTPPPQQNGSPEFNMEESPSRDIQEKPSLSTGFSFGGTGSGFGQTTSAPSSSPFGAQTPSSPFGTPASGSGFGGGFGGSAFGASKPEEKSAMSFGFGQAQQPAATPSTAFSFGQAPTQPALQSRPSSSSSFTIGGASSTPTNPAPAFGGFGSSANNGFGQSAPQNSAPASPSTFNQPSPFAFGAPPASNAFGFGSQPASPATGHSSLPQAPGSAGGFGGFGGQTSQPPSPFTTPAAIPPPIGGGLFTIGAAPPPTGAGGARPVKKMPSRRGAAAPKR